MLQNEDKKKQPQKANKQNKKSNPFHQNLSNCLKIITQILCTLKLKKRFIH